MIAWHVAAKATRDALYLTSFDVTTLPLMVGGAAVAAGGAALFLSGPLARWGPGRLLPVALTASALAAVVEWGLWAQHPHLVAIAFYVHASALGALVISAFWSVCNERFDPHTAKQQISKIAGGATLGGLLGGVGAERLSGALAPADLLPVLAALHLACVPVMMRLGEGAPSATTPAKLLDGVRAVRASSYLRRIALLVVLAAAAAGLVDYVFKARATAALPDPQELLAFFALFHTSVAVLTFLVQSAFGRTLLEQLGLARTVAALPLGLGLTAVAAVIRPSLVTAALARGAESVLRNAAFRSGYELFYTPVDEVERRSAKPIVDVGGERLGDAAGALIVGVVLAATGGAAVAEPVLLIGAAVLCVASLALAFRLHQGYVTELSGRLRLGAAGVERWDLTESTTRRTLESMANIDLSAIRRRTGHVKRAEPAPTAPTGPLTIDPVLTTVASLRSGDAGLVRAALTADRPPPPLVAPHIVGLLGWDEVAPQAIDVLRVLAPRCLGTLLDTLFDPETDGAIRRRIPRVLAACDSPRAVTGLTDGLAYEDVEIRFQCARALGKQRQRFPEVVVSEETVLSAARLELAGPKRKAYERTETDVHRPTISGEDVFPAVVPQQLEERALRHLFMLLSLAYDADALGIAYQGLHTDEARLRGTALEYLEAMLPSDVFHGIEDRVGPVAGRSAGTAKGAAELSAELKRSHRTILQRLQERQPEPT